MLRQLILFAFVAVTPGFAAAEAPEGVLGRIAESGEFRIGFVPDAPPLSFVDATGDPAGYSIELCKHIARSIRDELGLEAMEITYTPLVSMEERIRAVEDGRIDIECGATTVTLSRRERVDFTLMTFITGSAVLSRKGKGLQAIDDFAGKKVAVVAGTTTQDVLERVLEVNEMDFEIRPVKTHDQGMELLNAGTVDGYASDRAMLIGQVFRQANAEKEYVMTRTALSFEPYSLMIPRGDTAFRLAADRALASIYRTARIRRLYQDWFGRYGEPLSPIVEAMYQFQAVGD